MGEGELSAAFRALTKSAAEAARFAERTAEIEETNLRALTRADQNARVHNKYGQPVDVNGKPGSRAEAHVPAEYEGPWPK